MSTDAVQITIPGMTVTVTSLAKLTLCKTLTTIMTSTRHPSSDVLLEAYGAPLTPFKTLQSLELR